MTTLPSKKSMGPATTGHVFLLIALILAGFVLSPTARALLPSPTPDGGYPGNNTAEGDGALSRVQINTTTGAGIGNTAIGFSALASNTIGGGNTATGENVLQSNTLGTGNTATGAAALASNKIGNYNTASGVDALAANLNGDYNTATGLTALGSNTGGRGNTATGTAALRINTTGNFNTASGFQALEANSTGNFNTASGFEALLSNANGSNNTANGNGALFSNNTGNNNTGTGVFALKQNTTGDSNTATGFNALLANTTGKGNMATGTGALNHNTTGNNNTAVGALAGQNLTTGSDNINIGNPGSAGEGNKIRIGTVAKQTATFIAGIHGVTVASGVGVVVASNGQLGTVTSSARFKEAIKPMDKASEAILPLQPVTFRYKHDLDPDGIPQFGLIAEEVAKVNPDLIVRDAEGKVNSVRYEAVNAMLLNEFLKEHRKVEEQERKAQQQDARLAKQEANIAQQQKQIEALTATVQKVSDQVALSKPEPKLVVDHQVGDFSTE